ncbi:MAG: acyl--CoA ligase [Ignavibacteria bacterium]|nr:acyl--CoA ligase [Ignavibacteria bacterium]
MDKTTIENIKKAHSLTNNKPDEYFVAYENIYKLLQKRVNVNFDKEYLVYYSEGGDVTRFTYEEFIKKVYKLANYLLENDVRKEHRVGTFLHNHYDTVILYFACWCIGAVVVPVNVSEEPERVNFIFKDSNTRLVFTLGMYEEKLKKAVHDLPGEIVTFEKLDCSEFKDRVQMRQQVTRETEAMIVYTSGTTGNPKGVVLTQYNLMIDADGIAIWHKIYSDDVMMCVLPIHHVNGTVVTIMTTMYVGGKLILNQKFQTDKFLQRLQDEKIKIVSVVPTLLQFMIHSNEDSSKYNLESFSHIICGAGPLTCEVARNFEEKFNLRIAHGYGLSETTCYSCFIPIDLPEAEHYQWQNGFGYPAIGIPIYWNEMEIHNDKGESQDENVRGEIVIRGHNVMKFYFNNDEANKKTFEFGWFRSGDEGFFRYDRHKNKYFFITGRIKELIIRGGVNISTLEVDEVISQCEFVRAGICVGFENDWYGEEVGALILLKEDVQPTEELKGKILKYFRSKLPAYKSPKVIIFSDAIPVTSTGKYQRNKVKHLFSEFKTTQFK